MQTSSLGNLVSIQTGKLDANASSPDGAYPFFTCAREPLRIANWKYDLDAVLVAGNGDLNVKHYKGKFDAYQRTYIISSNNESLLCMRYLFYFMDSYMETLREQSIGGIIKYIKLGMLTDAKIPLPPLEEQKRIAAILDQADDIRRKRHHAIDRLNQLGQSIFYEMFEYHANETWPTLELADVVKSGTIVTYGIVQAGEEYPNGIPYIRTGDIKDGHIATDRLRHTSPEIASKFERSRVRQGEIVMSIRATVGTVAFVPAQLDGANLTQGTARIAPGEKTNPQYLIEYLKSASSQAWIAKQVKGATFREITLTRLRELPVRIPPMVLQNQFSSITSQISKQLEPYKVSSSLAESAFTSLQHRAFTGRL